MKPVYTLYAIGCIRDAAGKFVAWYDREEQTLEMDGYNLFSHVTDDEMALDIVATVLGHNPADYSEDELLDAEYDLAVAEMSERGMYGE